MCVWGGSQGNERKTNLCSVGELHQLCQCACWDPMQGNHRHLLLPHARREHGTEVRTGCREHNLVRLDSLLAYHQRDVTELPGPPQHTHHLERLARVAHDGEVHGAVCRFLCDLGLGAQPGGRVQQGHAVPKSSTRWRRWGCRRCWWRRRARFLPWGDRLCCRWLGMRRGRRCDGWGGRGRAIGLLGYIRRFLLWRHQATRARMEAPGSLRITNQWGDYKSKLRDSTNLEKVLNGFIWFILSFQRLC